MINPFIEDNHVDSTDSSLVDSALKGSKEALEQLIQRHQQWIYNIAMRMVLNPQDAEDVTQDILIKIITKLSTFKRKSAFRTWIYRIVKNHVINMKKRPLEQAIISFDAYGKELDDATNIDIADEKSLPVELHVIVEEAKIGCMVGMLLCLDREQRFIYILGEIFKVKDTIGSEIVEVSKDNFRQKLSRARKQLHNFMNEKCGLINKDNPCRCERKVIAWIKAGHIDPNHLKFNTNYLHHIKKVSEDRSDKLCSLLDQQYSNLYREHPFQNSPNYVKSLQKIMNSQEIQAIFNLN